MKEILFYIFHPIRAIRIYFLKRKMRQTWNAEAEMCDELFNGFIGVFADKFIELLKSEIKMRKQW